jgi:hypothetical protein
MFVILFPSHKRIYIYLCIFIIVYIYYSRAIVIGWVTKNLLAPLSRTSEGTLSCWSWLHLQTLEPTNPHWARVVGYNPFSLCVIHKEGLCPSSGDIQ